MRSYEDLAFLASLSAIAIDSHIKGRAKEKSYSNVEELAKELDKFSKEKLDPIGLMMLAEVIWPDKEDLKEKNVDDVYLQTNRLAKNLVRFEKFPRKKQEGLRDICVELSKQAKRYHVGKRVPHTYFINFFNR